MKDLLRIAVVWNIPVACNRASADFMISSTLMTDEYERLVPDYQPYQRRYAQEATPASHEETVPAAAEIVVVAEEIVLATEEIASAAAEPEALGDNPSQPASLTLDSPG